jgi:hypothetical protein
LILGLTESSLLSYEILLQEKYGKVTIKVFSACQEHPASYIDLSVLTGRRKYDSKIASSDIHVA